jgi:hypothetical protein
VSAVEVAIRATADIADRLVVLFDWRQACGYVASALVLATFWMRQMVPLRVVAICSNVAFFSYATLLGLPPVAILHAVLLPVNVWRLCQLTRRTGDTGQAVHPDLSKAAKLATRGAFASALSLLLIGAAASNTSDDEIHCKVDNWRQWSAACRHLAKAEYLSVHVQTAVRKRHQASPSHRPKYIRQRSHFSAARKPHLRQAHHTAARE